MTLIETKNVQNLDAMFVISLLTNPQTVTDTRAYQRVVEILSAYAYAYSSKNVRDEIDAMNLTRINVKKIYLVAVNATYNDDVKKIAAIENFDAVFNKYYLRLLFISLHERRIFQVKNEHAARTFYDFKTMRKELAREVWGIVDFYLRDTRSKQQIKKILEEYISTSGGGVE